MSLKITLLLFLANFYNYWLNFFKYTGSIRKSIKTRILNNKLSFVGVLYTCKSEEDVFETFLDKENIPLLFLVWKELIETINPQKRFNFSWIYADNRNINKKIKCIVLCIYRNNKRCIEIHGHDITDRNDNKRIAPLYAILENTTYQYEKDVSNSLDSIMCYIRMYKLTLRNIVVILDTLNKLNISRISSHIYDDMYLKICNSDTFEEQIFKANDILYI